MKINTRKTAWTTISMALALLAGAPAVADDTELLLTVPGSNDNPFNANILLIIDSSGSMGTLQRTNTPYNSATVYAGTCDTTRLYWSDLGQVPNCDDANTRYIERNEFECFADRL